MCCVCPVLLDSVPMTMTPGMEGTGIVLTTRSTAPVMSLPLWAISMAIMITCRCAIVMNNDQVCDFVDCFLGGGTNYRNRECIKSFVEEISWCVVDQEPAYNIHGNYQVRV